MQLFREARQLVFDGKYSDAGKLINAKVISRPSGQMPYETAGDLILTFPDSASVENYRRDLNLDTAVATVEYTRWRHPVHATGLCQPGGSGDRRPSHG